MSPSGSFFQITHSKTIAMQMPAKPPAGIDTKVKIVAAAFDFLLRFPDLTN